MNSRDQIGQNVAKSAGTFWGGRIKPSRRQNINNRLEIVDLSAWRLRTEGRHLTSDHSEFLIAAEDYEVPVETILSAVLSAKSGTIPHRVEPKFPALYGYIACRL